MGSGRKGVAVPIGLASLLFLAFSGLTISVASAATGDLNVFAGTLKPGPWTASGPAVKVALNAAHGLAYDRNTS